MAIQIFFLGGGGPGYSEFGGEDWVVKKIYKLSSESFMSNQSTYY